ncbi:MAG: YihY/virulence factor BrkB family protein [Motilibacteraceae bacterium]
MSSVTRVPETASWSGGELTAEDARQVLARYGRWRLAREAYSRFRYGDGFSHARAFALQSVLALVPLAIATVGLGSVVHSDKVSEVIRRSLLGLTPGGSEGVVKQTLDKSAQQAGTGGKLALWLGLLTAVVALTTAMGQLERGANRIYGIQRDRPTLQKYSRAAAMSAVVGVPLMLGLLLIVAGGSVTDAVHKVYGTNAVVVDVVRWPLGLLLVLASVTAVLRWSPRRRQPGWSWLSFGAGVSLLLWLVFTGLLALYVAKSSSFGQVYGPLTGVIALLVWANLTAAALFLGVAFAAQLEAVRAGVLDGAAEDPEQTRLRTHAATDLRRPASSAPA